MKRVRTALIIVAVVTGIFVVGIGLALAFINPNDYKPEIEAAVREATGKKYAMCWTASPREVRRRARQGAGRGAFCAVTGQNTAMNATARV